MKAVRIDAGRGLEGLDLVDLPDPGSPGPGEIRVRVHASSLNYHDYGVAKSRDPKFQGRIPLSDAGGVVEAVGEGVTYVKPGDHVIACLSVFCGGCDYCLTGRTHLCQNRPMRNPKTDPPKLRMNGTPVNQFASISGYAEKMLMHEHAIVKITPQMPLDKAALIGCGVTTGVGAVLNTAKIEPGSSVAVFGCGGVGLAAIQGARIAGARQIIALDTFENKLATARELGATHIVDCSSRDPVEAVKEITGGGVDYSFEAIGPKSAAEQAFYCLAPGGTATVIGMIPEGERIEIPGSALLDEKRIGGSNMGSNRFRIDMPRYVDLYLNGRLKLDELVTQVYPLDDVEAAVDDLHHGKLARGVLSIAPSSPPSRRRRSRSNAPAIVGMIPRGMNSTTAAISAP